MTSKFQIQDLVEQSQTRTIHRVRESDGTVLRLTRLLLDEGDREIEEQEIQTVSKHASRLLDDFGPVAGAVSFDTAEIFFSGDKRENCNFQIDYFRWFADVAAGDVPGANCNGKEQLQQLLASLSIRQLKLPKKKEEKDPIPFVDDRSPALRTHEPVSERWFGRLVGWFFLIGALALIGWLTVEGMGRVKEYPRLEDWKKGERP